MSKFNEEIIPLMSTESDEEETTEKQIFEHFEQSVLIPLNDEADIVDIHHMNIDSSLSSCQTNLSIHRTDDSETSLKPAILVDDKSDDCVIKLRALPDGKKYHFFVSFCRQDEDLVKPIIEQLEDEGLR